MDISRCPYGCKAMLQRWNYQDVLQSCLDGLICIFPALSVYWQAKIMLFFILPVNKYLNILQTIMRIYIFHLEHVLYISTQICVRVVSVGQMLLSTECEYGFHILHSIHKPDMCWSAWVHTRTKLNDKACANALAGRKPSPQLWWPLNDLEDWNSWFGCQILGIM